MEKQNWALHVLVDAKTEYTKQLQDLLCPRIYEGISSLFEDSKELCCRSNRADQILITFQKFLSNIPKWKPELLQKEYNRIVKHSDCEWLEDLITAVFVSYTKVLTAIKISHVNPKKPLDLKVPKGTNFLHKCYVQVAREFWKNPYLFDPDVDQVSYQRNLRECHSLIHDAIEETIRKQLPVQNILKEYLGDSYVEEEDNDVMSIVSKAHSHNLQKMIQKDLSQSLQEVKEDNLTDNYSHYKLESNENSPGSTELPIEATAHIAKESSVSEHRSVEKAPNVSEARDNIPPDPETVNKPISESNTQEPVARSTNQPVIEQDQEQEEEHEHAQESRGGAAVPMDLNSQEPVEMIIQKSVSTDAHQEISGVSSLISQADEPQDLVNESISPKVLTDKPPSLFSDSKTGEHVPWKSQKLENLSDTSSSESEVDEPAPVKVPQLEEKSAPPEIKIVSIGEPTSTNVRKTTKKGKSNYKPKSMEYSFYD